MSKNKELVTQEASKELTTVNMSEWGDVAVESKDFIMPKILLQQAMSEAVKSRVANDGDYFNTLTESVCSDDKGNVKVLPFFCKQSYTVDKWNGSKFVFDHVDPYIEGVARAFEETKEGVRYKVTHCYNFFCLLEEKGLPAIVPFKSTSNYEGKRLFNLMYISNPQQKKTPAHNWITLGRKQEVSKGGDKYFVMGIELDRESTIEELNECRTWVPIIKAANYKEADEKPETQQPITETRF